MAYKFTGRIKEIEINIVKNAQCKSENKNKSKTLLENNPIEMTQTVTFPVYNRCCVFDIDNTVTVDNEKYGVAYQNGQFDIVEKFQYIDEKIFSFLQSFHSERFEVEYVKDKKTRIITKVTVVK